MGFCERLTALLKEMKIDKGVYFVATVGEETTGRGAKFATTYVTPTCAIALDVGSGTDVNYRDNFTHEVKLGNAEIWTVINGLKVQKYNIKITALQKQNYTDVKGITFKVVDNDLLNKTGGIVAGMSGSPIIQNNKLVGAVTHVITDNVDYGYGVYMEWMYNEALKLI